VADRFQLFFKDYAHPGLSPSRSTHKKQGDSHPGRRTKQMKALVHQKPRDMNKAPKRNQLLPAGYLQLLQRKRYSQNTIKFYYERVLGRKKAYYHLTRPKKEKKLPSVLSPTEVQRILENVPNLKHRCILMTLYSGGLRRSELINLKVTDIDSERMLIHIGNSKGNKDRYTLLSNTLLTMLRHYYISFKPVTWLFEGPKGRQYSATSIENIFKRALKKSGINKHATPHTLRHSFATNLLEQGVNLRYIQELLGHASSKTTEIYTRVSTRNLSQIINPLDKINPPHPLK
jgi:site-specific recombinase XerD